MKENRFWAWAAVLAVGVGAGLRSFGLGQRSLWSDELEHVYGAQTHLPEIWERLKIQLTPPLDYFLTRLLLVFEGIVPISFEVLVRLPACIFSLLALFFLGKHWIEKDENPFRMFLILSGTAFSAFLLVYAQEVRPYSMVFFFSLWSWELFRRKRWVAWTVVNTMGLWAHYFFPFLIFSQIAASLGGRAWEEHRRIWRGVGVQVLGVLLLMPLFLEQTWHVATDVSYRYGHAPTLTFVPRILGNFFWPFGEQPWIGMGVLALAVYGAVVLGWRRKDLILWAGLPMVLSWGISLKWNVTTSKNMILVFYPWLALAVAGLSHLVEHTGGKARWVRVTVALGFLGFVGSPSWRYVTQITKEDFRSAGRFIAARIPQGLILLEQSYAFAPVYLARMNATPERAVDLRWMNWRQAPRRDILLEAVRTVRPSAYLSRQLEFDFEREVVAAGEFRSRIDFAGLSLYYRPRTRVVERLPQKPSLLRKVNACRGEDGREYFVLELCCAQRGKSPLEKGKAVRIIWSEEETQTWLREPFDGVIPPQFWPSEPFRYHAVIPIFPSPRSQRMDVDVETDGGHTRLSLPSAISRKCGRFQ